jgi:type IV pilus assembly protein PilQ
MHFLSLALALPLVASAAVAQAPSLDARVNLNIADRSLEDVVAELRARSGANIVIIDPADEAKSISDKRVTIELNDVPWRDALDLVAEKVGGVVERRAAEILAVIRPPKVDIVTEVPTDIREVIKAIAKAAGANVVVGPEVVGTVDVRFKDVPWREALNVSAKSLGFVVVEEGHGVLRVVAPQKLEDQLETRTYQLRFLRPKSVYKPVIKSEFLLSTAAKATTGGAGGAAADPTKTFSALAALKKALSTKGDLDYIDSANVVIIRDTQQVHDSIRTILTRLDIEPAQVFVDVKFVSTLNGDLLNLGVDYGPDGAQVTGVGGQIPITLPFDQGSGGLDDLIIASPSGEGPFVDPTLNGGATFVPDTIFGSLSFQKFQGTLRLLQRDSSTEVIQAPKIIALDGNEATIFVGETIRYAEAKSEQGQAGGLQLTIAEAGGSPVEIGFQLLIRPNVVPGTDRIMMEVIPKETSLSGTSANSAIAPAGFDIFTIGASGLEGSIALPRTRSSTIVTTMMLDAGQTAVIGGLTSDQDVKVHSQIPFLGDIPVLGFFFSHDANTRERRSLIVFITPTIVHNREDQEALLQQELSRRRIGLKEQMEALLNQTELPTVPAESTDETPAGE